MSTNLIHVLTIVGTGARQVEDACEALLRRRRVRRDNGYGSDGWSKADHKRIQVLCDALISAAHELPVLYSAQYLDSWSVADSRFEMLKWPDRRRRQLCGDANGLVFYPSAFRANLLRQIERLRRTKRYRSQEEARWFVDQVREALRAPEWLKAPFLVVAISQCLGGSRLDEEIRAALTKPIRLKRLG